MTQPPDLPTHARAMAERLRQPWLKQLPDAALADAATLLNTLATALETANSARQPNAMEATDEGVVTAIAEWEMERIGVIEEIGVREIFQARSMALMDSLQRHGLRLIRAEPSANTEGEGT